MQNYSLFNDWCKSCGSTNTVELPESATSIHHSSLRCADCGKFIKWLAKQKNPEISVIHLLQNPSLESWQRQFLKAIACRSPSKAEWIVVEAIEAKINPVPTGRGLDQDYQGVG